MIEINSDGAFLFTKHEFLNCSYRVLNPNSFTSRLHYLSYPKSKKIGCLWQTFFASENKNSTSKNILPHFVWAVAFSTPSVQFANNLSRLSNPFCWYQLGLSFQKSSTELRRKEKSFYFLTELDWLQGNAVPKLGCGIFVTIYWPNFSTLVYFTSKQRQNTGANLL